MFFYDVFETSVGWVAALATSRGLRRLSVHQSPERAVEGLGAGVERATHEPTQFRHVRRQTDAYLRGDLTALDSIPLDLEDAPPFFGRAWEACRTIPPGETRSYAWLAEASSSPGAFRAAGQAMARNPLALIIPCHRVIKSDGGLGGYGGGMDGLKAKTRLLEMEKRATARGPRSAPES